jgi:hypothetical protein
MKTIPSKHANRTPSASPSITLRTRGATQRLTRSGAKLNPSSAFFHCLPATLPSSAKQKTKQHKALKTHVGGDSSISSQSNDTNSITRSATVKDPEGVHANSAYCFFNIAGKYKSLSTVFEEELLHSEKELLLSDKENQHWCQEKEDQEDKEDHAGNIGVEEMTTEKMEEARRKEEESKVKLQHGQTVETLAPGTMYLACPGLNCYRVQAVPDNAKGTRPQPGPKMSHQSKKPRIEVQVVREKMKLEEPGINGTQKIRLDQHHPNSNLHWTNAYRNFKRLHVVKCATGKKLASELTTEEKNSLPILYRDHRVPNEVLTHSQKKERALRRKEKDTQMIQTFGRFVGNVLKEMPDTNVLFGCNRENLQKCHEWYSSTFYTDN